MKITKNELKEIIREEIQKLKEYNIETDTRAGLGRRLYDKYGDKLSTKYPHNKFVDALVDVMKDAKWDTKMIRYKLGYDEDFLPDQLQYYSDYVKFKKKNP
jgi:ribosomal protein S17E